MRKFLTMALIAAVAIPAAASAQSANEIRRDRQDIKQESRQLDRARANGNPRDIREQRSDVAGARRELREDQNDRNRRWGRNDWSSYRNTNRALFARGNWRAPFRYNTFRPGVRIGAVYFGSRYWISDPWRYRLPIARPGTRWVRHYGDVILVDYRRGRVVDVYRNFYR